ncbi:MAG: MetQ/NlpA family ABC transporter substrate-binding protein [Lachnospiraceae bacterium]|nr:MetQ/NlpA family ABC transporter substrate-binding protein [Lachnospiraceae bacterium]
MKKKILALLLAATTIFATTACGNAGGSKATDSKITIAASITPHSELLEQVKPILSEEGITLDIIVTDDPVIPNTSLQEGSIDANFFQHQPYLDQFNEENGTDFVSIGATHYEPFAVYSQKITSLSDLPDGAKIAVPNNVANEARALLLLEQEGVITLKEGAGITATVTDIADNPKNITIIEIDPQQLVNSLPDVDAAVINGNYALAGGLSIKDSLAQEASDSLAAQTYKNIVVTSSDKANDPNLLKLIEALQSEEIQQYINDNYNGAVVPVK